MIELTTKLVSLFKAWLIVIFKGSRFSNTYDRQEYLQYLHNLLIGFTFGVYIAIPKFINPISKII